MCDIQSRLAILEPLFMPGKISLLRTKFWRRWKVPLLNLKPRPRTLTTHISRFLRKICTIIDQEIAKLLAKGIIEMARHYFDEVISNMFSRQTTLYHIGNPPVLSRPMRLFLVRERCITVVGRGYSDLMGKNHHVNYLELLATFFGLQSYCKLLRNAHIRLFLDNTTAISVINHMGTSHSCNKLGKVIWEWCIPKTIWISAAHIRGVDNTEADSESRETNSHTEWMIDSSILKNALSRINFEPDIEHFPTRLNAQFPNICIIQPLPWGIRHRYPIVKPITAQV